jgi:RNA polymerase sigma-70 factor (ECF subfamily)
VRGWLFTVAYHQAMLARRQQKARMTSLYEDNGPLPDPTPAPWLQAAAHDDARRLQELLQQLPANQREVIRQRIYEGKRFREIAATLHCPLNTALARMHVGLKRLRLLWEQNHFTTWRRTGR